MRTLVHIWQCAPQLHLVSGSGPGRYPRLRPLRLSPTHDIPHNRNIAEVPSLELRHNDNFIKFNRFRLIALHFQLLIAFTEQIKKVPFSMAIGNVELLQECFPKHSMLGTATKK